MNVLHGSRHLIAAALVALLGAASAAFAQPAEQNKLKWTPHRSATAPAATTGGDAAPAEAAVPVASPAPTAPAELPAPAAESGPTGGAASVVLPDGVPALDRQPARVRPSDNGFAPLRSRADVRSRDSASPNRIPGALREAFDPSQPDGILGLNVMRSPQGEVGRPVLAPEGRQVAAMERAAGRGPGRRPAERLGGGLAPRYAPTGRGTAQRPERLAMNTDAIPSVMKQAPTVGGLDDTGVPGRTAPGAGEASESLPTPRSGSMPGTTIIEEGPGADGSIGESMPLEMGDMSMGMDMQGMDMQGMAPGQYDPEMMTMPGDGGMLMGEYPTELHVESFYDDPYECEDECMPFCMHDGRICAWLRQFGKPYYGWRWYRDFTASAGVTAFTNSTDLGINGNFGTNEYLNWAMPFWNAFGVGWQAGWRGTQTNFQATSIDAGTRVFEKNARNQNFVTTGFFTRAFEGRGLQGGAVYDYLSDNWFDTVDVAQIRTEISYVWGYHEAGFWSAHNIGDQIGLFGPATRQNGVASTVDLYCGFYRLQFGDANEWKVWGGGTADGDGIVGSLVRAPMGRSLALEGTFTYLIPGNTKSIDMDGNGSIYNFSPAAWNLGINVVYYPAGRSRRSLASPYRPLFEVADNGSMIRSIGPYLPTP